MGFELGLPETKIKSLPLFLHSGSLPLGNNFVAKMGLPVESGYQSSLAIFCCSLQAVLLVTFQYRSAGSVEFKFYLLTIRKN